MLIISNNCVGGFCYKFTNSMYNNPFTYTMTRYADFIPLITERINFGKFKLVETDYISIIGKAYDIIVDEKCRIHFSHYRRCDDYETPKKIGINVYGKYIYKYVVDKYVARATRMCKLNEPMTFAFSWHPPCGSVSELCNIAKLCESRNLKYVIVTPNLPECQEIFDTISCKNIILSDEEIGGTWVERTSKNNYQTIINRLYGENNEILSHNV